MVAKAVRRRASVRGDSVAPDDRKPSSHGDSFAAANERLAPRHAPLGRVLGEGQAIALARSVIDAGLGSGARLVEAFLKSAHSIRCEFGPIRPWNSGDGAGRDKR